MPSHDAFLSYAAEDNDYASDIALGLKANGLSVWFAPVSLRVGDKLLESIEQGLAQSRSGILLITPKYLAKNWTSFEMDVLLRQHVEAKKKLLPIWHGVTKTDVDEKHLGLGGIVAITEATSVEQATSKLIEALSDAAPSRGVIPGWEEPAYRFLEGLGEVNLQNSDGPASTIFELLLHGKEHHFPFWLAGRSYTKIDLLLRVAQLLGPVPDRVKNWVREEGYDSLWKMCEEYGIDPNSFH
jgi:hypothetical protein